MGVQYEPELFPGLIYRMASPKIVLLIFVSGKIVLTGAKERVQIYEAFENIYPVLQGASPSPHWVAEACGRGIVSPSRLLGACSPATKPPSPRRSLPHSLSIFPAHEHPFAHSRPLPRPTQRTHAVGALGRATHCNSRREILSKSWEKVTSPKKL